MIDVYDIRKAFSEMNEEVKRFVLSHPEIDAVPVVHGEWIVMDEGITRFQCSACGAKNHRTRWDYCPHCGAKMDGGKRMSQCSDCIHEGVCYKLTNEYLDWDVFDASDLNNVEDKCEDFIKIRNINKDYTPIITHLREDWTGHREEAAEAIEELARLVEWYEGVRDKKPNFANHDDSKNYD